MPETTQTTPPACVFHGCDKPSTHVLRVGVASVPLCDEHAEAMGSDRWSVTPTSPDAAPKPGPKG